MNPPSKFGFRTLLAARLVWKPGHRATALLPREAFSLVEVTLALGVVSFAMVAVLGLLPVGLKSVKQANEQAGAANVLTAIASSLRTASSTDVINFSGRFAETDIQYSLGGSSTSMVWSNLTLEGGQEVLTGNSPRRLSARLDIVQTPANLSTPGRAVVSIAWSAQANPTWDATAKRWTGADGSITSGLQFLPRR